MQSRAARRDALAPVYAARITARALAAGIALVVVCPAAAGATGWPFAPTPIGTGAAYRPPPRWPLAGQAAFRGLDGDVQAGVRFHLELFANGLVVVVPGGIGVSGGRTTLYGAITDALWHAPAWSLQVGGVFHLERAGMRLGAVFAVWGEPLGPDRLLGFAGGVRTFVNGAERIGDPAALALGAGDEVVLEVGGYVPPHPAFAFPPLPGY
jgi:hypothetical protein